MPQFRKRSRTMEEDKLELAVLEKCIERFEEGPSQKSNVRATAGEVNGLAREVLESDEAVHGSPAATLTVALDQEFGRGRTIGIPNPFLVLIVVAIAIALAIPNGPAWLMYGHFVLFGLAFGAVVPLRALAMDQWYGRNHYGRRMGIQQSVTLVVGGLGPLAVFQPANP